jgi:signal peptidase
MPPALLYEELPDDDAFLEELIALVDRAFPRAPETPAAKKSGGKTLRILFNLLFYALLAALVAGAFFLSRGDKKPVFGYSFMNVITWSMEPVIPQGSLVVNRAVDPNTIQIGDDITYMKDADTNVTHRVVGITEDFEGSGARGFETQGVDNENPDFEIVRAANVVGVVRFHAARVGGWLEWLRAHLLITAGFALGIVLLFVFLKGAFRRRPEEESTGLSGSRSRQSGRRINK